VGSFGVGEESHFRQPFDAAVGESRDLVKVVFRVILHRPDGSPFVGDCNGLDTGKRIAGEQHGARRQVRAFVFVTDEGIEYAGFANIQRMGAAFRCQRYLACNAHFTSAGIGGAHATGGDHTDLRGPTASEAR
jgi:hypothetical protein